MHIFTFFQEICIFPEAHTIPACKQSLRIQHIHERLLSINMRVFLKLALHIPHKRHSFALFQTITAYKNIYELFLRTICMYSSSLHKTVHADATMCLLANNHCMRSVCSSSAMPCMFSLSRLPVHGCMYNSKNSYGIVYAAVKLSHVYGVCMYNIRNYSTLME